MRNYSYEIRYNNAGELTSEYIYNKLQAIKRYIEILTQPNNWNSPISELKIFRNAIDITTTVNKFLLK